MYTSTFLEMYSVFGYEAQDIMMSLKSQKYSVVSSIKHTMYA